jgi:hypothetical protein
MKQSPSGSQLEKLKMKQMMLGIGIGRTGIPIQSSTASNSCSGCHLTEHAALGFLCGLFVIQFYKSPRNWLQSKNISTHACHPDGCPCNYCTCNKIVYANDDHKKGKGKQASKKRMSVKLKVMVNHHERSMRNEMGILRHLPIPALAEDPLMYKLLCHHVAEIALLGYRLVKANDRRSK